MELISTLRSTGAVRDFLPEPIGDDVLRRLLDTARFAPSGGNRQGWRVIVVKDPGKRAQLRDIYLKGWYQYLAMGAAGLVAWAPVTDLAAEAAAIANAPAFEAAAAASPGFAEKLDTAPVLLLVVADLSALAAIDRDLDRYTFAGGASLYPFIWNLLLAARAEDIGGVMTTVAIRNESEVKALFEIPDPFAVAALVVLGHPRQAARKLRRAEVDDFTWVDRYEGDALPQ